MAKKEVIETTAEEIKDQVDSSEETATEEKGLEKAHPVKAFVGGIKKAVTSVPGKIIGGTILLMAVGYTVYKAVTDARPTGAEAFPGCGDGTGSDQSASENTES